MTKTDGIAEVLQKLNLSKDEETTLEKAFKDPKFKELFAGKDVFRQVVCQSMPSIF